MCPMLIDPKVQEKFFFSFFLFSWSFTKLDQNPDFIQFYVYSILLKGRAR